MITWEYIAGLFDGEGSIVVGENNWGNTFVKVQIAQANSPFLYLVRDFLGYGEVKEQKGIKRARAVPYTLDIFKKEDIHRFLSSVLPHLILKKMEAELVLPLCENRHGGKFSDTEKLLQSKRVSLIKETADARRSGAIPSCNEEVPYRFN